AADRGVREHRDELRLYFEDAARDEDELLGTAARRRDAHCAGLDAGDERRMAGGDAELARLTRQHDGLGFAGVNRLLGAYDIHVDSGVRHQSFFAFSCASSIVPTM